MSEITGVWLGRDRSRIAVQLNEKSIVITTHGAQTTDCEVDHLPGNEWDELYPAEDAGLTDPPPETR